MSKRCVNIHVPCKPLTSLNFEGCSTGPSRSWPCRCGLKWCWWICWAGWFWEGFVPRPGGKWIMKVFDFRVVLARQFWFELVFRQRWPQTLNGRIFPKNVFKIEYIYIYIIYRIYIIYIYTYTYVLFAVMSQNQDLKANHGCGYWTALLPAAPVLFVTWHFWNIPRKSLKLWWFAQNNIELFFSNIVVFLWFVYANHLFTWAMWAVLWEVSSRCFSSQDGREYKN